MHSTIGKIGNLLHDLIGLNTESVGHSALDYAVRERMRSVAAPNLEAYWRLLSTQAEIQALIEAIVVPETWFFRHPEAFEHMADFVMGTWLSNHPNEPLRVLSVPCSTGEEPFSVAMALLNAGLPRERLVIDAVDVSAKALRQAREGLYRPYSFRNENTAFRDHYFTPEGEHFRLTPDIQSLVHFQEGNILTLASLPAARNYDLVFCRNLLIYLHEDSRQAAIANLALLLSPGGWLFTGAAEATFFRRVGFRSAGLPGVSAFERVDETASVIGKSDIPLVRFKRPKSKPFPSFIAQKPTVHEAAPPPGKSSAAAQQAIADSGKEAMKAVISLADAGQFEEAHRLCEAHLKAYGESAQALYMLGLLHDAQGQQSDAETCYRRALYLEPEHVEAMHHLASLLAVKGDEAQATTLRERARRVTTRQGG